MFISSLAKEPKVEIYKHVCCFIKERKKKNNHHTYPLLIFCSVSMERNEKFLSTAETPIQVINIITKIITNIVIIINIIPLFLPEDTSE